MKRERSDSQTIVLTTKDKKQQVRDKALELGLVTKSGNPCMSDLIRMSLEYAIDNYQRVTIVDYNKETHIFWVMDDLGSYDILLRRNAKLQESAVVGKVIIVDFIGVINGEERAICIDVLD